MELSTGASAFIVQGALMVGNGLLLTTGRTGIPKSWLRPSYETCTYMGATTIGIGACYIYAGRRDDRSLMKLLASFQWCTAINLLAINWSPFGHGGCVEVLHAFAATLALQSSGNLIWSWPLRLKKKNPKAAGNEPDELEKLLKEGVESPSSEDRAIQAVLLDEYSTSEATLKKQQFAAPKSC